MNHEEQIKIVIGDTIASEIKYAQIMSPRVLSGAMPGAEIDFIFMDSDGAKEKSEKWKKLTSSAKLIADINSKYQISADLLENIPIDFHEIPIELSAMFRSGFQIKKVKKLLSNKDELCEYMGLKGRSEKFSKDKIEESSQLIFDLLTNPLKYVKSEKGDLVIFLSADPLVNYLYIMKQRSLSKDHILAMLAIAGIDTALPSIFCESDEVLLKLREKYPEERHEYLSFLREYIQECYERIADGYYKDAWEYAQFATNQKLISVLSKYEAAISKSDKKLIKRIKIGAIEGIPAIASSIADDQGSIRKKVGVKILKIVSKKLAEHIDRGRADKLYPMASVDLRII